MRILQTETCGPGRDWQNGKRHPSQIIYGQNSGRNWEEMLSWGRSKNRQLKNQSSIMLEDYEEFISLTLRTCSKEIGNTSGSRYALQDKQEEQEWGRPVARLMIWSQNLRVSWKPVQECVWKNLSGCTGETWKDAGVGNDKCQNRIRGDRWKEQKFILPYWWTSVIWRMPNWRQSTKNTKVELYSEAIL